MDCCLLNGSGTIPLGSMGHVTDDVVTSVGIKLNSREFAAIPLGSMGYVTHDVVASVGIKLNSREFAMSTLFDTLALLSENQERTLSPNHMDYLGCLKPHPMENVH